MSPRVRTRAPQDGADRSFYAAALAAADRVALEEARQVEGLAEEIALLRLHLRHALAEHRDDTKLIETGMRLLIQSLLAQHRLSPKQAEDVTDAFGQLLEELTEAMRDVDES